MSSPIRRARCPRTGARSSPGRHRSPSRTRTTMSGPRGCSASRDETSSRRCCTWPSSSPRSVVSDQVIGCPTYTGHLASAIAQLAGTGAYGLHHVAASGSCSWFEFAQEIFDQTDVECRVMAATTDMLAPPATRVLRARSERPDAIELPEWRRGWRTTSGSAARREARLPHEVARHGRGRVHRLELRPPQAGRHPDDAVVVLDKLTYAGRANLDGCPTSGSPSARATSRTATRSPPRSTGATRSSTSPRATSIARSPRPASSSPRTVRRIRSRGGRAKRHPAPPGLHRRVRVDRRWLVHRGLLDRPLLVLRLEGGWGSARAGVSAPTAPTR